MDSDSGDELADVPEELPNPSDLIHDYPTQIAIADLLNPTMIRVSVWDEAEDPAGTKRETFKIMRGIICSKSAYFEKTFNGSFKEALEGKVTLTDVSPWIFKVFLTWLYTGLVYIDPENHRAPETSRKRKLDDHTTADDSRSRKTPRTLDETDLQDADAHVEAPADASLENHYPTGYIYDLHTYDQEICDKSKSIQDPTTDALDEKDPSNPVTWPWQWLFDIYVFADQYDTIRLREQIMNFIQLRLDQRRPRMYTYPNQVDTARCVDRLPTTSPLRRLLVDLWAKNMQVHPDRNPGIISKPIEMDQLPQSFLVECFMGVKQELETARCDAEVCTHPAHNHSDGRVVQIMRRCRYHEHERTVQEMERCSELWWILQGNYWATSIDAGVVADEETATEVAEDEETAT